MSKRRDAVSALECLRYVSQHGLQEAAHGHWQTAAACAQSLIRTSLWIFVGCSWPSRPRKS